MEHNMARNPNWWETNNLAMLQAWLRTYTRGLQLTRPMFFFSICLLYWIFYLTVLFTWRMSHIYDQSSYASGNTYQLRAPQELKRGFWRGNRQLIRNYYSETSTMRNDCLSYGNGQQNMQFVLQHYCKTICGKAEHVVRLITNTTTGPHRKS